MFKVYSLVTSTFADTWHIGVFPLQYSPLIILFPPFLSQQSHFLPNQIESKQRLEKTGSKIFVEKPTQIIPSSFLSLTHINQPKHNYSIYPNNSSQNEPPFKITLYRQTYFTKLIIPSTHTDKLHYNTPNILYLKQ